MCIIIKKIMGMKVTEDVMYFSIDGKRLVIIIMDTKKGFCSKKIISDFVRLEPSQVEFYKMLG